MARVGLLNKEQVAPEVREMFEKMENWVTLSFSRELYLTICGSWPSCELAIYTRRNTNGLSTFPSPCGPG